MNWKSFAYDLFGFWAFSLWHFLCLDITWGALLLSARPFQQRPMDEQYNGQIGIVWTFCGVLNIATRARISSTFKLLFASWTFVLYLKYLLSLLTTFSLCNQRSIVYQQVTFPLGLSGLGLGIQYHLELGTAKKLFHPLWSRFIPRLII